MAKLFTDDLPALAASKTAILVVENGGDLAARIVVALLRGGFDTVTASHAGTACEWLSQHRTEVIVANLMLPDLSGFELIKLIRATPKLAHLPIIALADRSDTSLHAAAKAGATATLMVPRELDKLVDTVNEIMRLPSAPAR